jgi:hypothetical protein
MCAPIDPPDTLCRESVSKIWTVSGDVGGQSLSETTKFTRGQCVGESSTGTRLGVIRRKTRMEKSSIVSIWTNSWVSTSVTSMYFDVSSVEGVTQFQAYICPKVQQVTNDTDALMW